MISSNDYAIIWDRDGTTRGVRTGGTRRCPMAGCNGIRIHVRWPDGKTTYPCSKGLRALADGSFQIA